MTTATQSTATDNPTANAAGRALMLDTSNLQVILRLLAFMSPFNDTMMVSLIARIIKLIGQAIVLGIAAASVGLYINSAEPGVVNWDVIWTQVMWIALFGTIVDFASYIENYTGHYVAFRILAEFRDKFYYAMLPLAPAKTAKLQSGDSVSRVMNDCERIEPFYAHTIAPAVSAIVVPIVLLAWCWTVDESLVYVLAPFYLANTAFLPWLVAKLGGDGVEYRQQIGEVNAFVADSIQGVRDTVAFGYEKSREQQLYAIGAQMQKGQDKLYGADATQRALAEIFITIGILAATWWGVELVLTGVIDPLVELPAVIAVNIVGFYLSVGLANNFTDFRVSMIAARRLFAMMDEQPAVFEQTTTEDGRSHDGSIHLRGVGFEYDSEEAAWSRATKIFDGLDLDIQAGAHVALVGPSDTGKSTVINLLLRQWDPDTGSICLGDKALTEFTLAELQRQFSVVSQRSFIFNETIEQNIRMGRPDATAAEVRTAAEQAGLGTWLDSTVDGLQTQAGERGSKISGGQRQRVAIARAILKDAPIVLLDESTSSLDVEIERSVMQSLKLLCQGRTTLTIAHRLSTVVNSDEILVMLEGRIAERGTHAELMATEGWYASMFRLQQDEVDATLAKFIRPVHASAFSRDINSWA